MMGDLFKVLMSKIIIKIRAINASSPHFTGHWVIAEDIEMALSIAKKFGIGNPMGGGSVHIVSNDKFGLRHNHENYKGKVWEEVNGELIGHKLPIELEN